MISRLLIIRLLNMVNPKTVDRIQRRISKYLVLLESLRKKGIKLRRTAPVGDELIYRRVYNRVRNDESQLRKMLGLPRPLRIASIMFRDIAVIKTGREKGLKIKKSPKTEEEREYKEACYRIEEHYLKKSDQGESISLQDSALRSLLGRDDLSIAVDMYSC